MYNFSVALFRGIFISDSTLPSVSYTVIYMVRVGLGLGLTDGNVLSLTACVQG